MDSNELNLNVLKDLVGTQYGDMTGIVQIDGHQNLMELYELCAENGIDKEKYFLIGFGISDFTTTGVGSHKHATCTVLLLETEKYAQTFDEIKVQLSGNPNVDVIKKTFQVDYKDFGKYIKRIDALMLTEMGNYIQRINIIEEDNQ